MTERTGKEELEERLSIIRGYAHSKLVEECSEKKKKAELARRTGFSTAHITNVLRNGHRMGEKLLWTLVDCHWGISRDELWKLAQAWDAGRAVGRAEAKAS